MTCLPIIGIAGPSYVVPRPWGDLAVTGSTRSVLASITEAGGAPVILPLSSGAHQEALRIVDGLVLAGGGDIDPLVYGSASAPGLAVDRGRDDAEVALLHAAHREHLPVLGLCRGAQIMAVAYGGTLIPHLDGDAHILPEGDHLVDTAQGSLSRQLLGERVTVNSLHHQAIADPGTGWRITARADDSVTEAIEWQGKDWAAFGVQWHPELAPRDATSRAVFGWLVEAARLGTRVRV